MLVLSDGGATFAYHLTGDQRYLCRTMGTKLPLLPVTGPDECRLFEKLVLRLSAPLDFDEMAIVWCEDVDVDFFRESECSSFPAAFLRGQQLSIVR